MTAWLYQMTANDWSTEDYRLAVWEGKALNWSVGRIYGRGQGEVSAGDKIILFFCKSQNDEPGIYGWGDIKGFIDNGAKDRCVKFVVKPPSDGLKMPPCWNDEVENLIDTIRGNMTLGTLWGMTRGEFSQLRKQILPNPRLDGIERKIVAALRSVHEPRAGWTDKDWTSAVKRAISRIGREHGFKVCGADGECEFIFDLCWREQDNGIDRNLALAMESEWNSGYAQILYDFQKLLVSRADHRLLVCRQDNREDWTDCLRQLVAQIRSHRATHKDDHYLFACRMPDGWQFRKYPTVVEGTRAWLFQAIKEDYDLKERLKHLKKDTWDAKCHRDHLQAGDIALLWQAGEEAGIYGIGELTSGAYLENKKWYVKMRYGGLLDQPVLKSKLLEDPLLQDLGVIKMARNRNPFRVRDKEWQVLKKLIGASGR